jgi:DNA-binding MarR family transcriptional regulator
LWQTSCITQVIDQPATNVNPEGAGFQAAKMQDARSTDFEIDEEVLKIGTAWSKLLRRAMLPRTQDFWIQAAGLQVDRASYWILRTLGESDKLRLSELAQAQGTDISTICRQVRPCEESGLIRREGDPSDLRAVLFTLTDAGREALARMQAVRAAALQRAFAGWSAEEKRRFARMTRRFVDSYVAEMGTKA